MGGTDLGASEERPCLVLRAPFGLTDVPALCDRAGDLMSAGEGGVLECDVAEVTRADLRAVEALARIHLTARRRGGGVRLRGASVELLELLAFCGLPMESVVEAKWQAEQREEPGGVKEEGDSADPVA